ncbi:YbhB/YbcL family Raf kinase inhibitor-like protein [Altererythrobacter indicus]|uniref:YbhB/YbcL family Raf kinase inhibitor-like protein n=1 Tax=Altericroceibacterium indicum TaxID=374177 RepID=A0A845A8Z5_9SPHN|nr:YbhB/YbcL family Raf kinase inhibitor-like protein [Altericroceibacterium indicum]MXP25987.1 YbhB/YbcL family Raf kinase inhibitor-like protein [Altericroceibacterium indicum]
MKEDVPAWLGKVLHNVRAGHGKLTVAQIGDESLLNKGGFALSSAAFKDGEELDPCFTADEEDAVAPPFEWTAPPPSAHELVLIAEDPDAPGEEPFCHWLVWGLPAQKGQLLEGETPPRVGKNSLKNSEWALPQPPIEDSAHDYVFQLFALDLPLTVMPGASRKKVIEEMKGHVVAVAVLTATYAREPEDDDDWDEDELD